MNWLNLQVRGLREEAEEVLAIELRPSGGAPLALDWQPGAHVDVEIKPGLVRQYSLTNLPGEGCLRLAVKREPVSRGGSRWLHESLRIGSNLRIGEPRNLFPLQEGTGEVWLVAAGIGITPLLTMYRHCQTQGRPVRLLYFARSAGHAAFAEVLEGEPGVSLIYGLPAEEVGGRLRAELPQWQAGRQLYTCGPSAFMDSVFGQAADAGWPAEALHREHFQAAPGAAAEVVDGLQLMLSRSGRSVTVEAGETLVAAAQRVGVSIPVSCGMGMCGCCMTRVLDGEPEHRDQYLSDAERDSGEWILPCVSGCRSARLELDC